MESEDIGAINALAALNSAEENYASVQRLSSGGLSQVYSEDIAAKNALAALNSLESPNVHGRLRFRESPGNDIGWEFSMSNLQTSKCSS